MASFAYPSLGCGRISYGLLDGCNPAANVMFRSVHHHGAPTNVRSGSMFVSSTTFPAWTSQKKYKRLPDQHPTTIKLAHLLCALYRRNSPLLYRWIVSIGPHARFALLLQSLDIRGISFDLYAVILLFIALTYRVLLYVVLVFKKR